MNKHSKNSEFNLAQKGLLLPNGQQSKQIASLSDISLWMTLRNK